MRFSLKFQFYITGVPFQSCYIARCKEQSKHMQALKIYALRESIHLKLKYQ